MSDAEPTDRPELPTNVRQLLARTNVVLPKNRVKVEARAASPIPRDPIRAEAAVPAGLAEYLSVKARLHQRLLDEMNDRDLLGGREEDLAAAVREFVDRVLETEDVPLNEVERRRLAD